MQAVDYKNISFKAYFLFRFTTTHIL